MINRVDNRDRVAFLANLNITDKANILSKNSIKRLQKIAKSIGSSSDEINIDVFSKNRVYINSFGDTQVLKEPHVTVVNCFNSATWEDNKPDIFLRDAYKEYLNSSVKERELNYGNTVFTILKDYLTNFAEYNSAFISKGFQRLKSTPVNEKFEMSSNIDNITYDNIEKLMPLYRKYQEGMNQVVDDAALREYIEKILDNNNKIFVISDNGVPCGFLHFSVSHSTIDMSPFTTLQSLFVDASFRKKGFAQKLLGEVARWTDFMDFKGISVKTQAKNPASVGLYNRVGFISEEDKYAMFFLPNSRILDYKKGYVNTKSSEKKKII